ncbi:hypothetical protein F4811DRAFT_516148 [Daldinia bambusicola]|nr:hypothetical protein F4811DRAFT_516148 [Daldinia bambusicola]
MLAKILTLATTVTAAIIPRDNAETLSADYIWDILKWQAGESHGAPTAPITGWYDFNVSAPEYGDGPTRVPAFFAHCAGSAAGNPLSSEYSDCDLETGDEAAGAAVSARVLPVPGYAQAHIAVSYLFDGESESRTKRNFTVVIVEDWARERPPHNFSAGPTEAA